MKGLLAALGREVGQAIQRPATPEVVMREFCRAMSVRTGRAVCLIFRPFPADIPVSGLRMDLGDQSLIVVEEHTVPEAQLVILGHELWHEEQGECGHHVSGASTAARSLTSEGNPQEIQRVAAQILAAEEVPHDAVRAVAARAESVDDREIDAETFGLLFGHEVRTWMTGRHAQNPVTAATVEGRLHLSLLNRDGGILR
ncbi:toxin [Streptomyces sp. NPDC046985]|uniref:toxin n=1 Tax=Streptomyces sp. NPDC046985 TaxID=3155377 RepID=UPI0033FF1E3B